MPTFDEEIYAKIRTQLISEIEIDTFNEKQLIKLAQTLAGNKSVKSLKISKQKLTLDVMHALAIMLSSNESIAVLSVKNIPLNTSLLNLLCQGLKKHSKLIQLELWDCNLCDCDVTILCEYLKNNGSLRQLHLWGNNLGTEKATQIFSAIAEQTNLLYLDIGNNSISKAEPLKQLLLRNNTLLTLDSWLNQLTSSEATKLCQGLQSNTTLTKLELRDNPLGTDTSAINALCDLLKHNHTLVRLNLSNCQISEQQAKKLQTSITANEGLADLNLVENQISRQQLNMMRSFLFPRKNLLEKMEKSAYLILRQSRIIFTSKPKDVTYITILTKLPADLHVVILSWLDSKGCLTYKHIADIYHYAKLKQTLGQPKEYFLNTVECNRHRFFKIEKTHSQQTDKIITPTLN